MHRARNVTSAVWSNSSITGNLVSKARRTGLSLKPSSASRMPTALALMPTRCRWETALGEPKRTRASSSSTITPSPTRGAALESATGPLNGNEPSAIIDANRWNSPMYVRSSSPGCRPERLAHSRLSTAMTSPSQRTGMAIMRTGSGTDSTSISPSQISPLAYALPSSGSSFSAEVPT